MCRSLQRIPGSIPGFNVDFLRYAAPACVNADLGYAQRIDHGFNNLLQCHVLGGEDRRAAICQDSRAVSARHGQADGPTANVVIDVIHYACEGGVRANADLHPSARLDSGRQYAFRQAKANAPASSWPHEVGINVIARPVAMNTSANKDAHRLDVSRQVGGRAGRAIASSHL
ncbi:hypothetical protein D3C71_1465020 [compost metagenome]